LCTNFARVALEFSNYKGAKGGVFELEADSKRAAQLLRYFKNEGKI